MSKERVEEFVARNAKYAQTHKASPHIANIREIVQTRGSTVILTCSDPRVTPEEFFGLNRLEAAVIRNAGGRSIDSIRSLQALDTIANVGAIIVVHHTDCGGLLISDDDIYNRMLERNPEEAKKVGRGKFGTFGDIGLEESIRQDVEEIQKMPFLRKDLYVAGYSLDIDTGVLKPVVSYQGPSL